MDSFTNHHIVLVLIITLCSCLIILPHIVNSLIIVNHELIYITCSNQTSSNPSLNTLFQQFIAQSTKSNFFETIVAADDHDDYEKIIPISGSFQCRHDLSPNDCKTCVSKFPFLSNHLCGERLPSRIHLSGCYARYQAEDGPETYSRPDQLLHRACSKRKVKRNGFEEMKYAAFSALESGVVSGDGFFETTYEAIHVVAQCEGSLRACDCGECVYNAVQIAMEECRYSVSGEIYLDSCFISYSYYGDEHGFGGYSFEDNGIGKGSPKVVAIAIGGLAVLILGLALCYFIKSCGKKKDDARLVRKMMMQS